MGRATASGGRPREYSASVVHQLVQAVHLHILHTSVSGGKYVNRQHRLLTYQDWTAVAKRLDYTLSPPQCQALWRTIAYLQYDKIKQAVEQKDYTALPRLMHVPKLFDLRHVKDDYSDVEDDQQQVVFRSNSLLAATTTAAAASGGDNDSLVTNASYISKMGIRGSGDVASVQSNSIVSTTETKITLKTADHFESNELAKKRRKWSVSLDLKLLQAIENIIFPIQHQVGIDWQKVKEQTLNDAALNDRSADELQNRWKTLQKNVQAIRYKNERIVEWVQSLSARLQTNPLSNSANSMAPMSPRSAQQAQMEFFKKQQEMISEAIAKGHTQSPVFYPPFIYPGMFPPHMQNPDSSANPMPIQMMPPFAPFPIPPNMTPEMLQSLPPQFFMQSPMHFMPPLMVQKADAEKPENSHSPGVDDLSNLSPNAESAVNEESFENAQASEDVEMQNANEEEAQGSVDYSSENLQTEDSVMASSTNAYLPSHVPTIGSAESVLSDTSSQEVVVADEKSEA